ncbi:unnamed protein product [Choristocarpus tenellus]
MSIEVCNLFNIGLQRPLLQHGDILGRVEKNYHRIKQPSRAQERVETTFTQPSLSTLCLLMLTKRFVTSLWLCLPTKTIAFAHFGQTKRTVGASSGLKQCRAVRITSPSTWDQVGEGVELDATGKIMLKGLVFSEMEDLMVRLGEAPRRAVLLARWMYHDRRLIRDIDEAAWDPKDTYRLGREVRAKLRAEVTMDGGLDLEDIQVTSDGTRKMVSRLTTGEGAGKHVETVIIPMQGGPKDSCRYTVCVSSQVGCAMNCQFCYTGRLGLMANLQTAQMVEQVLIAKRYLESEGDTSPVTGVVYMGMGEPFDNYDRVMRSVKILTDPTEGVRLRASRVTVSTVGLVPQIELFCSDQGNRASIAVSLHATTDAVRDKLIPVNRRYPLANLMEVLEKHFPSKHLRQASSLPVDVARSGTTYDKVQFKDAATAGVGVPAAGSALNEPPCSRRILSVEYTLLDGVNDSLEDAVQLAKLLRNVNCVVNLITFNTHKNAPFRSSSPEVLAQFRRMLTEKGQLCTVRDSRGDDGMAACGQLGGGVLAGAQERKLVPVSWVPQSTTNTASTN